MADGQGPTNTTKNAGPNEPFGKKSKIVRRNPQMNTPATFAASSDRKTFSDNVRKELDMRAVERAQKALQHVKESGLPEFPEGDETEEEPLEEGSLRDPAKKAARNAYKDQDFKKDVAHHTAKFDDKKPTVKKDYAYAREPRAGVAGGKVTQQRASEALDRAKDHEMLRKIKGSMKKEDTDAGAYAAKMAKASERIKARRVASEGKSTAKADKADKAHADRMKVSGSKSFISVRKA
jgi:hypothetical protein